MGHEKIAKRYARATFDFLKTPELIKATHAELVSFDEMIQKNEELRRVMNSEVYSGAQKKEIVADLAKKIGLSAATQKVLSVISEAGRIPVLKQMALHLSLLLLEKEKTVLLKVITAAVLESTDKQKVEEKFSKILGKKVEATYEQDPSLLGGMRILAGGKTFDGSLQGWINQVEEKLMGGSL